MTVVTMGWKQWINGQRRAHKRAEAKLAQFDQEDAIRAVIKAGKAELMADGYYRISVGLKTYIYGPEYVERIQADWGE